MALTVQLQGNRTSRLALGRHFVWLAAFGYLLSVYAWSQMFLALSESGAVPSGWSLLLFAYPAAGVMLIRFGIGLIADAGDLPAWLSLVPLVLFVPMGLLVAYGLVMVMTTPLETSLIQWSRYLLIFPGCLLAAFGCLQQWRRLSVSPASGVLRETLLVAAVAFLLFGVLSGLVTDIKAFDSAVMAGLSIEVWRVISIVLLTVGVMGMMRLFEIERQQILKSLEQQRHQVQREAATWLEAVVNISHLIASMPAEDDMFGAIVKTARQTVGADVAALALRDQHGKLTLRYQSTDEQTTPPVRTELNNPHISRAVQSLRILRYPQDGQTSPFLWSDGQRHWQVQQAGVVPLLLDGVAIGVLWTGRHGDMPFSCHDLSGLGHLGNQAVIALEQVIMTARLQSLAMLEERSRIAREMHDGLAQLLGYLGITMQTLEALIRQGETEAALAELVQVRREIKSAHADVRQNILSLRTTLANDISLKLGLQTYVEEFGLQTGIQTRFCDDTQVDVTLSALATAQLTRIIQEALTNVRKHAQASQVCVRLETRPGWLEVEVVDDGSGFQPEAVSGGHFGLQIMRERAEDVGGMLIVDSHIGKGTTIRLTLPLL